MKASVYSAILLFGFIYFLTSCEKDNVINISDTSDDYSPDEFEILSARLNLPSNLFSYDGSHWLDPVTGDHIATLGRVLFYDKNLSLDNSVSCGSCHQQLLAFADDDAFSTGIMNRSTARNTLALGAFLNFGSYGAGHGKPLFWDGRVNSLHDQMIQTIANPNEMGMEMNDIVPKISNYDYYKVLTKKAFGYEFMNEDDILLALEIFMNSITSGNSKFDKATHEFTTFTDKEIVGKNLFQKNCTSCHQDILGFTLPTQEVIMMANNGLDLEYEDKGEGEHNPIPEAIGVFKVPALRNISLTAPYMHDGRFQSLEQVIAFYSTGIQEHPNLHRNLKENGQARKFNFTAKEQDALIHFLRTLTDVSMTSDPKWSDPFF